MYCSALYKPVVTLYALLCLINIHSLFIICSMLYLYYTRLYKTVVNLHVMCYVIVFLVSLNELYCIINVLSYIKIFVINMLCMYYVILCMPVVNVPVLYHVLIHTCNSACNVLCYKYLSCIYMFCNVTHKYIDSVCSLL